MIEIISVLKEIWWQILLAFVAWFAIMIYMRKNPEALLARIEKNAIKTIVNGETIYLKKSGFWFREWRVIYPPINEDGTENKMNKWFGGKGNLIRTLVIVAIVFLAILGVYEIIGSYNDIINNPIVQSCLNNANIQLG